MMSYQRTAAFLSAVVGVSCVAAAQPRPEQRAPSVGFFDWDTRGYPASANFTASPFLSDNPADVSNVRTQLMTAQSQGRALAVKIIAPLQSQAAKNVFNDFAVQYVFGDFEDAQAVGRTRAIADLVLNSTRSQNAFVGNFNFYPQAGNDPTRPGAVNTIAKSFDDKPQNFSYPDSRGRTSSRTGRLMSNESLYPGSPDFRNPAQGNSNAPNIRSALFTLPIIRAGFAQQNLPAGDQHIPWVSRFNNWGNNALDSDGNPANGYQFVQNNANPANGQLPSRGDFSAQVLHYRLRGANSVNLFEADVSSVVGYSREEARSDVRSGWSNGVAVNQIFARNNFAFANLGATVNRVGDDADGVPVNSESTGVVYSGVYDRAFTNGARVLAVLISNLSNSQREVDLPNNIGGAMTFSGVPGKDDDYLVPAGAHRYLTFEFSSARNRWQLSHNSLRFTDQNRNGVGIPEPTVVGLLGVGALGLLARRRRTA